MNPVTGVFHVAVAGVCMARGLSKEDAEKVMVAIGGAPLPTSVGMAYDQIDAAINEVRDQRQRRRK